MLLVLMDLDFYEEYEEIDTSSQISNLLLELLFDINFELSHEPLIYKESQRKYSFLLLLQICKLNSENPLRYLNRLSGLHFKEFSQIKNFHFVFRMRS